MVEPRLEQAAEAVERRLEQAAEKARSRPAKAGIQEGKAGMLDGLRFLLTCRNNAFVVIPA